MVCNLFCFHPYRKTRYNNAKIINNPLKQIAILGQTNASWCDSWPCKSIKALESTDPKNDRAQKARKYANTQPSFFLS